MRRILQVPDQVEQIKYHVTNGFTFMYLEVSKCFALLFLLSIVMLIVPSLQKKRVQERKLIYFFFLIQKIFGSVCNKPTITGLGRTAGTTDTYIKECVSVPLLTQATSNSNPQIPLFVLCSSAAISLFKMKLLPPFSACLSAA